MENLHHFIAGWGAGIFGVIVGHPMDTIKTHQQMSNIGLSTKTAAKVIIANDGVRGFYKGMLFPLICSGSLNSAYFGVYDASLKSLQHLRGNTKVLPTNTGWIEDLFVAGSAGGAVQALITCPSEFIKIRMQVGKGIFKAEKHSTYALRRLSTSLTILDIYNKYGLRAFFVGFIPTVWRDAFGGGVYILSYQYTRHYLYGDLNLDPGLLETLVAGGVAGIASWLPVIPFDTVKSRIQADSFQNPMYKGMIDCSMDLFKRARVYGFYKGFFMITVRSIPVNISIIYGYELILWLSKHLEI